MLLTIDNTIQRHATFKTEANNIMYYTINVAINNRHHFATRDKNGIIEEAHAIVVATELHEFYSAKYGAENVSVNITLWMTKGQKIDFKPTTKTEA